jgi:hypothetical protein
MIRVVHPGSRIRMLTFYPSRIQGSKRHPIPDPDPQHCLQPWIKLDLNKTFQKLREANDELTFETNLHNCILFEKAGRLTFV